MTYKRGDVVEIKKSCYNARTQEIVEVWSRVTVLHASRFATNVIDENRQYLAIPADANWIRKVLK